MRKENVIVFPQPEEEQDIYAMTLPQLQTHYAAMQEELMALDAREPNPKNEEAYEAWADEHEELEDYLDTWCIIQSRIFRELLILM